MCVYIDIYIISTVLKLGSPQLKRLRHKSSSRFSFCSGPKHHPLPAQCY